MILFKKNKLFSFLCALLFACHPAISEAVNCVTYNEDLLTTIFFLLSFLSFRKMNDVKNKIFYYCSSLFYFMLALLSKEMAIVFPAIIFMYDVISDEENKLSVRLIFKKLNEKKYFYSGYIAVILLYLMIRFVWLYFPVESKVVSFGDFSTRLMFVPHNILLYLRLAIFPFFLNADYFFKYPQYVGDAYIFLNADYIFKYPEHVWNIYNLLGLIFISALIYFSFKAYNFSKKISFGIWWYLIALMPVTNIIQIANPWAERYLYLPMFGFCIVIIELLNKIYLSKKNKEYIGYGIFAAIIIFFSILTISRNTIWEDQCSLWKSTVEASPESFRAHNNLGRCYTNKNSLDSAVVEYKKAIALNPTDGDLYKNLGSAYYDNNNFREAANYYQQALNYKKNNLELLHMIVQCYYNSRLLDKALEVYNKLISIEPKNADNYNKMGIIYLNKKQFDESIRWFQKSLQIKPNNVDTYFNLGSVYATMKDYAKAISMWEKVLSIRPDDTSAKNNIIKAKSLMTK